MNTKQIKIVYRVTTGIICMVATFSAVNFSLSHPIGPENFGPGGAFAHLGLPRWFKFELTTAKVLGFLAFLIPGVPRKAREFAYVGFAITFVSASIAHTSVGDPLLFRIDSLLFLVVLIVSYWSFNRMKPRREYLREQRDAATFASASRVT